MTDISGGIKLDDAASVANACENFAGGMEQQSIMASSGSALGGHPNPAFFYGQVAMVLKAAAELLKNPIHQDPAESGLPCVDNKDAKPPEPEKPKKKL